MNRRAFLRLLAGGVAGFALDPDRLLWVPGQRTHFIMPSDYRHIEGVRSFISSHDLIEAFKHVYGADRLAQLAQQEVALWHALRRP